MSSDLQIHFQLHGQLYSVDLKAQYNSAKTDAVVIGGVAYSLQGNREGMKFVRDCLAQLPNNSLKSLDGAGKELKVRLWLAGAKEINLTSQATHKIGLRILGKPVDIPQTIEAISVSLERFYVFPETAKKCSEYLYRQLREGAYDAISDLETKGNWEGIGIIPDHMVSAKDALEAAISLTK